MVARATDDSSVLSLRSETWAAEVGAADNPSTRLLLEGLNSSQSGPAGWNAVVQASILAHHIKRVDNTTLHIEMPSVPAYAIAAAETLMIRLLPVALKSRYSTAFYDLLTASELAV